MKPYELDQKIMGCWQITNDLDSLFRDVVETDKLDRDTISNAILGLKTIYDMKFNHLYTDYETMLKELHEQRKA